MRYKLMADNRDLRHENFRVPFYAFLGQCTVKFALRAFTLTEVAFTCYNMIWFVMLMCYYFNPSIRRSAN